MVAQIAPEQMAELLNLDSIRVELAEKSFRHFVRQAWDLVEPGRELQGSFYIDAICDHLQAVAEGDIKRLLITLPPGFLKSTLVSVLFPAWLWTGQPSYRFLTTSHDSDLAMRDSVRSRRVITSDWYQARWGDRFAMTTDQNVKTRYENDQTGHRISLGVNSAVTGKRADMILCDDPHDAEDAWRPNVLEETVRWWNEIISSRLNDPKTGARIVIQQRLHESDLAGAVAEQGYEHLNLPMEYEPSLALPPTSIGWSDPRTEPGELLHPERYGPVEVAERRAEMGTRAYEAQYQQNPRPAEGGILKRAWLRFWQHPGQDLPPVEMDGVAHPLLDLPGFFDDQLQSWDLSFTKTQSGSYVAGLVGGVLNAQVYLLDLFHERTDFPGTVEAFLRMSERWPDAVTKLVEDKANGPALMDSLRGRVPGITSVSPDGTKEARMHAVSPFVEGGGLILPHPRIAAWVEPIIDEITTFPMAAHDDRADALSQLLRRVMGSGGADLSRLRAYMDRQLGRGR